MFWNKNHFVKNLRQLIDEKVFVNDKIGIDGKVILTSYTSVLNEMASSLNISVDDLINISDGKLKANYLTKLKIAQYFHLPMKLLIHTKLWGISLPTERTNEKPFNKLKLVK